MTRTGRYRRGATVLEMSIVLGVFAVLTLGMLDLGIGVFRYHVLANAARHGVRRAIVHGEHAMTSWGPGTIDVPATASGIPIIGDGSPNNRDGVQRLLVGCDLDKTRIVVEWPEGSNAFEKQVRVTVTSPYEPIMLFLTPVTLRASSTMQIAH